MPLKHIVQLMQEGRGSSPQLHTPAETARINRRLSLDGLTLAGWKFLTYHQTLVSAFRWIYILITVGKLKKRKSQTKFGINGVHMCMSVEVMFSVCCKRIEVLVPLTRAKSFFLFGYIWSLSFLKLGMSNPALLRGRQERERRGLSFFLSSVAVYFKWLTNTQAYITITKKSVF